MKLYDKRSFAKNSFYISTKYDVKTIKSFQDVVRKIIDFTKIKDMKILTIEIEYDKDGHPIETFVYKKNTDIRFLLNNENCKDWNIIAIVGKYKKKDLYLKFYKKGYHKEFDKLGIKVGVFLTGENGKNDIEELDEYIKEIEQILY